MAQDLLEERPLAVARIEPRASRRRTHARRLRLGWLLLAVVAIVFAARVAPGMSEPFSYVPGGGGLPVDSYNDAVFSLGGRALHDLGPVDSKLGGVWGAGDDYADHPPLIYSATALSQSVVGDEELAARGVAFVASLATIVLLFLLLRELGVAAPLAALSVGVAVSVPMFVQYGTMLDTLVLGLPFAVGYLLLWQRSIDGRANPWALGGVAAAAVLTAWEGALLIAITLVVTLVVQRGRRALPTLIPAAAGLAGGVTVTLAWVVWVYGGLTRIVDQGAFRAGGGGPLSAGDYLDRQLTWLRALFGIPALAVLVVGLIAALANPRFRPVGVAALATSVVYAGVFRQGSWQHDYWNYWVVVPVALAIGALAFVASRVPRPTVMIAVAALAVAVVVTGFTADTPIYLRTGGADRAPQLDATRQPVPGQRWVPLVQAKTDVRAARAVWRFPQERFYLGPLRYTSAERASQYARRHPTFWVIVDYQVVRGDDALALLARS